MIQRQCYPEIREQIERWNQKPGSVAEFYREDKLRGANIPGKRVCRNFIDPIVSFRGLHVHKWELIC